MSLGTVGRYELVEELGRGASGTVYKGSDPLIGRTVALKTIAFREDDDEVRDVRKRLYREACAAGTLVHPNIVTIFDVIEDGGTTAVAMEYVDGLTLDKVIARRAPMAVDAALDIVEQIALALDFAHARGIVHRDIKPVNILVTAEGRVKVSDFGVARIATSSVTVTSTVIGAPSYMSPEQVRAGTVDARSDLFSAAVILYELLTGRRPFDGDDLAATMYRIVHDPPAPPGQFNAAIGSSVAAVLDQALAKDPNQRYRSGAEFVAAVRQAVGAQTFEPAGAATMLVMPPAPTSRRGRVYALAAIPVVLLLGLVVFGSLVGNKPSPNRAQPAAPDAAAQPPAPAAVDARQAPPPLDPPVDALAAPAAVSTVPAPPAAVSTVPAPPPPAEPERAEPPRTSASRATPRPPRAMPPPIDGASRGGSAVATRTPPPAEPPPPPPRAVPALLQLAFDGPAFPVTLVIDGRPVGSIGEGQAVSVEPGQLRVRAVNDQLFLDQDFGTVTLGPGERRPLALPAMASAFVGVRNDTNYSGLEIQVDGRPLPGPYPAQVARISAALHTFVFRWIDGPLRGTEIAARVDLSHGRHFSIQAVPATSQIAAQKLR